MLNLIKRIVYSNLVTNFWSVLNPYKQVDVYATYIETAYKIVDNPSNSKLKKIQFLTFFVLYYAFLNCVLYFLPLSQTTRLIVCDTVHLKSQGSHFYFIYAIFCIMVAYFYYSIYLYPNLKVNHYLFEALFVKNRSISKISFHFFKTYRNVSINEIIVNIAWTITNGLNLFQILLYFVLTANVIKFLQILIRNFKVFYSFIGLTVYLPIHMFHFLNYISFWFAYAHVLIHSASMALILFTYILIQLKEHYLQLNLTLSKQFHQLVEHQANFRKSVGIYRMIFTVNQLFSGIFFVFLFINMPINAFFIMTLALKKTSSILKIISISIALQQALCILMMHLFIAHLNEKIKEGGKILIRFTGENVEMTFKCKFLIWIQSMRLYLDNSYGITYGKFVLVTMKTYLNVSFNNVILPFFIFYFILVWSFLLSTTYLHLFFA